MLRASVTKGPSWTFFSRGSGGKKGKEGRRLKRGDGGYGKS